MYTFLLVTLYAVLDTGFFYAMARYAGILYQPRHKRALIDRLQNWFLEIRAQATQKVFPETEFSG